MLLYWTIVLGFCGLQVVNAEAVRLLFANRKDVRLLDTSTKDMSILANKLEDATAVDFDFDEQSIFWTEVSWEKIKRTYINNSRTVDVIQSDLVAPDGLACDWITKKLYWTDSETNRIETSHYDGSDRKVIYWKDLDQPRAIAVDPYHGYMYWTDWGESPKIERGDMDGNQLTRKILIKKNIYWPNGLTLDYEESRIYWADAKLNYIHSCKYDGSDRKIIIEGQDTLGHPFALTLSGAYIYWTDWNTRAIHKCNKHTGADCSVIQNDMNSPMDIHVFSRDRQKPGLNPCHPNNGGCSNLCLLSAGVPLSYWCACPTGVLLLKDERTCADGPTDMLLLARRTDLRRISLDTPDFSDMVLQFGDIKHAIAVDIDPVDQMVYWTDDEVRAIKRAHLNGSIQETIVSTEVDHQDGIAVDWVARNFYWTDTGTNHQETIVSTEVDHQDGIAVDWVARNFYWTDTGTNRIEVARLNGSSRRVVVSENLDQPRAIVVDPVRGYMYWTDWGKDPKIERANLDGSNRIVLINDSTLVWPNGLALDIDAQKLYWGDAKKDRIEVVTLVGDGTVNRTLLVDKEVPHLFGLTVLGKYLYWTDWQRRSIERVNLTGGERQVIVDQLPDLMGLKAVNLRNVKGWNECSPNNGHCSHLCLYRAEPRGKVCSCPLDLDLTHNNLTCTKPKTILLFSRDNVGLSRISIDLNRDDVHIPISGIKSAYALDYNIDESRIYWSDSRRQMISRAFINGSSVEDVIRFGIKYVEGLAVDWIAGNIYWSDLDSNRIEVARLNGNIYWSDLDSNRIEVARLNGSSRRVLVWRDLMTPKTIVLDPPNGHMYWSTYKPARIERANLDGSSRIKDLIEPNSRVSGLAIDFSERRLFWAELDSNRIMSADLDGGNVKTVLANVIQPLSIAIYNNNIFWTQNPDSPKQMISMANKHYGNGTTTIIGNLSKILTLNVYHKNRQSGRNSCGVNNGGCEHLCLSRSNHLPTNQTHRCSCPTHYKLNADRRTCSPPKRFLLFSRNNAIYRMLPDPSLSPYVSLPIPGLKKVGALDYDPVNRFVYWLDTRAKSVRRALEDGSTTRTIITNSETFNKPFDFSLDPYSRHIYWTCDMTNTIIVTKFDGVEVGAIIGDQVQKPRYIVVYPEKGLMFWSNDVSPHSIEMSAMDGTERVTLFKTGIKKVGALAIDKSTDKLYWTDTILKRIERSDLAGGNREVVVDKQIKLPIGVTVLGPYIFWLDSKESNIGRVNKNNKTIRTTMRIDKVKVLTDIHAVYPISSAQYNRHPCRYSRNGVKNGGCSHICMKNYDGSLRCSCPIGLALSKDLRTCSDPPTCARDHFSCVDGNINCIPLVWRCDGFTECDDKSDEKGCPVCSGQRFNCGQGICIGDDKVCNGVQDCKNNKDEENCCAPNEKRCDDDRCIPKSLNCRDAVEKCSDGTSRVDCKVKSDTDVTPTHANSQPSVHVTVVVVICLVVVVLIVFVLYVCCKKTPHNNTVVIYEPNKLSDEYIAIPHNKSLYDKTSAASNSNSLVYDRNQITGASSSSSTASHYPKETLNPPPSPITVRSQYTNQSLPSTISFGRTHNSVALPSRTRNHRRRAPPPTPCSTDICEESEPCIVKHYGYDTGGHYPPPPTPHYLSDEFPLPPTTHYLSDDISCPPYMSHCPPSPQTERSFYNPYPPPPSPVGNSDC